MTENPSRDIFPWLCLYLISGVGNVGCRKLIEHFGSAEEIFRSSVPALMEAGELRESAARKITEKVFSIDPEQEMKRIEQIGARIIPFPDSSYPSLLREIHDPPVLLYSRGKPIPPGQHFIAIVGSRNATDYGRRTAQKIALGLTENGIGISSGLARGVDASAHWGCVRGQGFTIAVLGTGVDIRYPRSNAKLFEKVLEQGAVVSEFPLGTAPEPKNFPMRNRIISGVSRGVVVVEATRQSGSLITAGLALEQGRDVFAVPGSVDSFKSRGPHFLIKQGAKLVEHAEDILSEIGYFYAPDNQGADEDVERPGVRLEPEEKRVFDCLGPYPMHIDQIIRSTGCAPGETSSILTRLELMGLIIQMPGMMFVRAQQG
ncbi:MAG: DNA-protecting protein DprA [Deltaproteobacteria bacterium]|nr:DNA-protecting protein DprA [Deltaproteobacteria bacterium]